MMMMGGGGMMGGLGGGPLIKLRRPIGLLLEFGRPTQKQALTRYYSL